MMERYLIVSSDAHLGPVMERDLRPYCPAEHLEAFDESAAAGRAQLSSGENRFRRGATGPILAHLDLINSKASLHDPAAFVADLDEDGIAASVLFAGGGNEELLPWGVGPGAGDARIDPELRITGQHIWNSWLADFVSAAPERLIGVILLPIFDLDRAIEEIYWGKEHGLGAILFPGPREDYPAFNDPVYDRFWSVVEEVDLPLVCHGGGGTLPWYTGPGAFQLFSAEMPWLTRRGLAQMMFGGVFDRFPNLRVGFTEQRAGWIAQDLRNFDSCCLDPMRNLPDNPKRLPSEYWRSNCFVGGSYMARFEIDDRHEVGVETYTWGSDYPHPEGTWPNTTLALRNTFAGVPEDEVRMMLGTNAVRVYGLDETALRRIADDIGPTPAEIDVPLAPEELPEKVGRAFRTVGDWA